MDQTSQSLNIYHKIWLKIKAISFEKKFIFLIILFALLNDVLWISVIPYNRGPDEFLHLQLANFIFTHHRLPIYGIDLKPILLKDARLIISPYASMPGLNYIFAAGIGWFLAVFFKNVSILYIGRSLSMIFHLLTIFLTYKITTKLFEKNNFIKLIAPTLVALIPQLTFVSSYINIDAFTMMTSTLLIYSLIWAKENHFNIKSALFLGFSIGLVSLSKYNAYILIILAFVFVSFKLKNNKKKLLKYAAIIIIIPIITSGWWFIRNARLYNNDFLGLKVEQQQFQKVLQQAKMQNIKIENKTPYALRSVSYLDLISKTNWLDQTSKSFWGYFGYQDIPLNNTYYQLLWSLTFLSFAGILIFFQSKSKQSKKDILMAIIAACSIIFVSLWISLNTDFQPQGRYLFPAISALLILFSFGLYNLFYKENLRKISFFILIFFFILINLTSSLNVIFPRYLTNLDLEKKVAWDKQPKVSLNKNEKATQSFKAVANNLNNIKIKVRRAYAEGITFLTVTLRKKDRKQNLGSVRFLVRPLNKDFYLTWLVPNVVDSKNKTFYLTLRANSKLTLPLAAQKYNEGEMALSGKATNKNLLFRLSYATSNKLLSIQRLWSQSKIKFWIFVMMSLTALAILISSARASLRKEYIN